MNFRTPRDIYFGWGTSEKLNELRGKAAIVTGDAVWKEIEDFIPLSAPVYPLKRNSPTGEPTRRDVESVAEFLQEEKPEWIVAVGGGSVIDSAKIAWIIYEQSPSWDDLLSGRIGKLRKKSKFAALETTSGTGTGISAAAIVAGEDGSKLGVVSPELVPDIAIYDPDLVMSMPDKTVIYTGMDALTHAIESFVTKVDNIVADTLSLKAIELIFENIKRSRERDPEARALMHYANMMAGMGFANSRLGLCHAAAHKIGGMYHVEHGKINAILLPHFIRATEKYTRRYETIEKTLGIDDLAGAIEELNRDFGIPLHFPELRDIDNLAGEIFSDRLMQYNPRNMSREEIREFLRAVAGR